MTSLNTPPSLPSIHTQGEGRRGGGKEERGKDGGREGGREGEEEEEEEENYVLELAVIKLCTFAVIRENLSIFTVIKKNVAAITPLGDFDMRP